MADAELKPKKRDRRSGLWLGNALRNPEEAQLQAELRHLSSMVQAAKQACEFGNPETAALAEAQFNNAQKACREKDLEGGWEHAYRAREQLVRCLSNERLMAQVKTLRGEVHD